MSFSQITQGPATTTGINTSPQSLIFDRQNGIAESVDQNGNARALSTILSLLQAQTALTTITTAQNLISVTLNKNAFNKKNRTVRVRGFIAYTTVQTSFTTTIALKLGAVTLLTITTPSITNAQTGAQMQFDFTLSVVSSGSAATIESHGEIGVQGGSAISAAVPRYQDQNVAVSSAVNLTSSLALAVTIAASAAIDSAQLRFATIEVLN